MKYILTVLTLLNAKLIGGYIVAGHMHLKVVAYTVFTKFHDFCYFLQNFMTFEAWKVKIQYHNFTRQWESQYHSLL